MKQAKGGDHRINYYYKNNILPGYYYLLNSQTWVMHFAYSD